VVLDWDQFTEYLRHFTRQDHETMLREAKAAAIRESRRKEREREAVDRVIAQHRDPTLTKLIVTT
jgi:SpoVK/Ycf46/Vps4 family AAA+-type ATPase